MDKLERIYANTQRILALLEVIVGENPPQYSYLVGDYPDFDWHAIGARVIGSDEDGVFVVEWRGQIFHRYSGRDGTIWFSKFLGRSRADKNEYHRLVTFYNCPEPKPLTVKARRALDLPC